MANDDIFVTHVIQTSLAEGHLEIGGCVSWTFAEIDATEFLQWYTGSPNAVHPLHWD